MKPPAIDVCISDKHHVHVTMQLVLVRERGKWVGLETMDGIVIGSLIPHRVEQLKDVMEAVAKAETKDAETEARIG